MALLSQKGLSTLSTLVIVVLVGLLAFGYTHYNRQQDQLAQVNLVKDEMHAMLARLDREFTPQVCALNTTHAFEDSELSAASVLAPNYHKIAGASSEVLAVVNERYFKNRLWLQRLDYVLSELRPSSEGLENTEGLLTIEFHFKYCGNGAMVYSDSKEICSSSQRIHDKTLSLKRNVKLLVNPEGILEHPENGPRVRCL